MLRIISVEVGSAVMNCRNVNALLKKKLYQQFRLQKAGRCREKALSGYKRRESWVQRHAAVMLPLPACRAKCKIIVGKAVLRFGTGGKSSHRRRRLALVWF